jgi:hypothetical protein
LLKSCSRKKERENTIFFESGSDAESRRADAHVGKPAQKRQFLPLTGE